MSPFSRIVQEYIGKNCASIVTEYLQAKNNKIMMKIVTHTLAVNFYLPWQRELKDYTGDRETYICEDCGKCAFPSSMFIRGNKLSTQFFKGKHIHNGFFSAQLCYNCYNIAKKTEEEQAEIHKNHQTIQPDGSIILLPHSKNQFMITFRRKIEDMD
jgi:hypothetical protein